MENQIISSFTLIIISLFFYVLVSSYAVIRFIGCGFVEGKGQGDKSLRILCHEGFSK